MTSKTSFKSELHLTGNKKFDIVIVGGGLAGLTLLLRLTESGVNAILIEANVIGSGASGKNGGFCSPGWSQDRDTLLKYLDVGIVKELDVIASEGVKWIKEKCHQPGYETAEYKEGILSCYLSGREKEIEKAVKKNNKIFGINDEILSKNDLDSILVSERYRFGVQRTSGFHFHPLNFLNSLANECLAKGGRIYENSKLKSFEKKEGNFKLKIDVEHITKIILADRIVFATGGYGGSEIGNLRHYWLPIKTFIGVTENLGKKLWDVIKKDYGVSDNRRAGNYYRIVEGNRISWGRGISALGDRSDAKIKLQVSRDIQYFFPQLGKVDIDYVWSGNMAYARHMMPYVGSVDIKKENGLFALTGFGGHGMNTAPAGAIALADHLINDDRRYEVFNVFKRQWNGGKFGSYAAEAKYRYLQLMDCFEKFSK